MQKKIRESGQKLQRIEHTIEIKKDDMDKFLDGLITDDVATSFVRLAREFMLRRDDLQNQVKKTLETAPLMAHLTAMVYADDRVAAKIGGVEEDNQGRLIHEAAFTFNFARIWLQNSFHRLFEKFEVLPDHFVGWANRHNLYDDMSLLMEGVGAWMRHDHVKAAHVLVPQIEKALRKIADDLGVPVTKETAQVKGTSIAIGMGEILYNEKIADALGPDLTLHFQALYSDPRGLNVRNEIAHGLMHSGAFYWHPSNLIVHSLLILGVWKELSAKK
jgi:lysyl-tRNA synthetase class 1